MMETKTFQTNLNCGSCVAKVTPFLNSLPGVQDWKVDTNDERKLLQVTGQAVTFTAVQAQVEKAGFKVLKEVESSPRPSAKSDTRSPLQTYAPLLLILLYLLGAIGVAAFNEGAFSLDAAMNQFMGGFFIVFSFFKFLNLKGFAESYQTYDVLAKKSLAYAYTYPFIELTLGLCYLMHVQPLFTNLATLIIMGVSSIGVIQSITRKQKIQCACLGTVFNLPMSTVTLVEDLTMMAMALISILK